MSSGLAVSHYRGSIFHRRSIEKMIERNDVRTNVPLIVADPFLISNRFADSFNWRPNRLKQRHRPRATRVNVFDVAGWCTRYNVRFARDYFLVTKNARDSSARFRHSSVGCRKLLLTAAKFQRGQDALWLNRVQHRGKPFKAQYHAPPSYTASLRFTIYRC